MRRGGLGCGLVDLLLLAIATWAALQLYNAYRPGELSLAWMRVRSTVANWGTL